MLKFKQSHLTKNGVITIFCLSLLVMYLITGILVGEFNALHQEGLIPVQGQLGHGKITDSNQDGLWDKYHQYLSLNGIAFKTKSAGIDGMHTQSSNSGSINNIKNDLYQSPKLIFNAGILLPLFGVVVLSIIIPLILGPLRGMNIDAIPFSFTLSITCTVFILSGAIPQVSSIGIGIARVALLLFVIFIFFLLSNRIINFVIIHSGLATQAVGDITKAQQEQQKAHQVLKDLTDEYRKKDNLEYVEESK